MPGEAEVADVGVLAVGPCGDEDVAGLHVSVHEPCRMGRIERLRDLCDEVERSLRREPVFAPEQLAQVRPLDVGHRQVEDAVLLSGGEGGDDVGMVEARRELCFAQEALTEALVPRQFRRESFSATRPPLVSSAR